MAQKSNSNFSAWELDRDLGVLRGHQGRQGHRPHDDDDDEEDNDEVEDNDKDNNNNKDDNDAVSYTHLTLPTIYSV